MRPDINTNQIQEIDSIFDGLLVDQNIMKDGAICFDRYSRANLRVMWLLKQNIDYGYSDYSDQLLHNLN